MPNHEPVHITIGLPPTHRHQAARLFHQAFERKLRALVPSEATGICLIEGMIVDPYAIAAIRNEKCIGVAGLHHGRYGFIRPKLSVFLQTAGWLRGLPGFFAFQSMARPVKTGELRIESLTVETLERGQGIGTRLLSEAYRFAQERGFKVLSLEVVDTNPQARKLYEREGFLSIKTTHFPFLKRTAGFSASTLMRKEIKPGCEEGAALKRAP